MKNMNIKRNIEFLFEIWTLRNTARTWNQFFSKDVANVSEHTLRVCFIAIIIAENEKVKDIWKVLKMALIHDIPEIRTGDVNYISKMYTDRKEEIALQDQIKNVSWWEEFFKLWQEFEKQETIEGQIIKDSDNLDVEFELIEQSYKGIKLADIFLEKRRNVIINKLYTETAKQIFRGLHRNVNPHDWHLNWKNRFNQWDFKIS